MTKIDDIQYKQTEIGLIPDDWKVVRLGEVCEINPSRPKSFTRSSDAPTTFIPMAAVDEKTGTVAKVEVVPYSKVSKGYTYFEENDVLFAKITPCMQNGKHVIARNLIDGIGFGTTEFHVLRPKNEVLPEWIYFFIRQSYFLQEATAYFTGAVGQQRIPEYFLADYIIPLPPKEEQHRIASKLQELMQEISNLQSAIRNQESALEALPSAYLREVFESEEAKKWEKKRLGEVCEIVTGSTPRTDDPVNWNGEILWATPNDMGKLAGFTIDDTERKISKKGFDSCSTKLLPSGSVLLTTRAPIGHLAINTKPMCTNQGFKSFIPSSNIYNWFLFFSLKWSVPVLQSMGRGQTFTEISKGQVESFEIPLPSLPKQENIANYLKEKMAQVENLQSAIYNQKSALDALPQAILRKAFRGELSICECMNATREANLWSDFSNIRTRCPALKEVLVPDNILEKFQKAISEKDNAQHSSISLLAFERGYLNRITSPIHRYLFDGKKLKTNVTKQYKNDLSESWLLESDEMERHKKARMFMGKLIELQCAEWLEGQNWKINNLEAWGGEYDIEASLPNTNKCAIEVKSIGQDDDSFSALIKGCVNTLSPYTACDYLLFRVYEAAYKLQSSTESHIAMILISAETWAHFDIQLKENWIKWKSPNFLNIETNWHGRLKKPCNITFDEIEEKMATSISSLKELWIVKKEEGFRFLREYIILLD